MGKLHVKAATEAGDTLSVYTARKRGIVSYDIDDYNSDINTYTVTNSYWIDDGYWHFTNPSNVSGGI